MRLSKFLALIFFVAQAGVSFARLAIDLDYACFAGRDSLAYVEVYASVQRSQLVHAEVDSGFISRFRLALDIDLDGRPLVTDTLHGVDAVANEEELKAGQFFPHVFAFYMRPGRYDARATLMDETGKPVERKSLVLDVRLIPKDRLTISDIELACTVQRTDEVSRFWKNGLHVLPNPIRFFGTQLPLFYYYCELYNLKFSEDFPDSFSVHRQIRSTESGAIVRELPSRVREKVGSSAVETDGFPITTLRTGTYVLEIRVTDLYDNSLARQSKKFWVYRPGDFEPGREIAVDTHFVDRLTEFALPAMEMDEAATALEQMRYILTAEENAQVRRLTPEGKVRFLKEYWVRVGRERGIDPEIVRWEHTQRVEEANRRFSYLKKPGWKTDRGRVFVQLGTPDLIDRHVAAQEVPDYEVWYYDKIEGGVQYIFADRSGFGNLELVHSTKRGEISDTNWLEKLAGRPISDPTQLSP